MINKQYNTYRDLMIAAGQSYSIIKGDNCYHFTDSDNDVHYFLEVKEKTLIGGQALMQLGSSRSSLDLDYLVNIPEIKEMFLHDADGDYINAAGHPLFERLFATEKGHRIASPQTLLELKSFALVQHCQNRNFQKADDCEYDMKFLCRKFNLDNVIAVRRFVTTGELSEITKIIKSAR